MRRYLLAVAISIAGLHTVVAAEWVVEAHYPDQAALIRAAAQFQHVIVDAERQTLRVDTDEGGIDALEDAGLSVSIDQAATARLRSFYAQLAQANAAGLGLDSIPGFQCFRTVEETYQTMDTMAANHPDIVAIDNLGPTWARTQDAAQGFDMRALRITNLATAATDPERPKMVVFGSIHAREYSPAELNTRFAEYLVNGYGTDPEATWLVDHNDFRLVLQANPDGRKKAENGISWRKNTDSTNGYCAGTPSGSAQPGIDLNRNFPFHWNIVPNNGGSSGTKCSLTYRGPAQQSEPETDNLLRYVAGTCTAAGDCMGGVFADRRSGPMNPPSQSGDGGAAAPDDTTGFFVDIHSNAALVLWPWGDTTAAAPNQAALRTLGRRLAWFNNYRPEQSDSLYPTDGATDDTMYGLLGVPGFTIETNGSNFFEDCATFENDTAPTNIAALRYAARALHAPYRLPLGPDAYALAASAPAQGAGGLYTTVTATIDDLRYRQTNGTQATYPIQAANAYVDTLPWNANAVPVALAASDGNFDGKTETVRGDISLDGLAPGRHIIYVQGINTFGGGAGTPGTPDAVFVDVPIPSGTVTVTPIVRGNGSIDPSTPQTAEAGAALSFTLTPAAGHYLFSVSGCGGTADGQIYTTGPLSSDCTVDATFLPHQYTVGGTIAGLTGSGLMLRLNGLFGQSVPPGATRFSFSSTMFWGSTYDVDVSIQPTQPTQICSVSNGHGTITGDVTDIAVTCVDDLSDWIFTNGFELGEGG